MVFGILFNSIQTLVTPHVGLLWQRYQPDYPFCNDFAPLASTIEIFKSTPQIQPTLQFTDLPPLPRVWFISSTENRIIQVQRDRFVAQDTSSTKSLPLIPNGRFISTLNSESIDLPRRKQEEKKDWYQILNQKLQQLSKLPKNSDSYGAEPPNATAIGWGSVIIQILAELNFAPTKITPSVEEGIAVSFINGQKYANVEL